jgi:hypothetical protein
MCRYAMMTYKPHYACFGCRKTFKRRLLLDIDRNNTETVEARCPQCGDLMADMGLDFASPKKNNLKEWEHIKQLYSVGITFHSCGCSGPGYIPNSREKLIDYFEEMLKTYSASLAFWRQRVEPTSDREIQREKSVNSRYLNEIPAEITSAKGAVSSVEAIRYWMDNLKQVEQKLKQLY